jgi:haloalkane dehalogenase
VELRDLTKSVLSFSWAMSLFGVKQAASMLNPARPGRDGYVPPDSFQDVTGAIVEQFGESLRQTFQAGDGLQREMVDAFFRVFAPGTRAGRRGESVVRRPTAVLPIFAAQSGAQEEIIISYTRGQGRFSDDKRYIALDHRIYMIDGRENGHHQGVWERLFDDPRELISRPNPPVGPLNEPVGPVERGPIAAATKAMWAFSDGAIFSVGPAASHLIPLSDGSFLFLVSTAQVITHGTGRFQGAYGLTQSLGATHVPQGVDLFGSQPVVFPATTMDTFKIKVLRSPPAQPARPRAAPRAAAGGETCSPADSKRVDVLGSKMHYVEQGAGGTILFLHGNPSWSYLWRNVLPHVSGMARCVAPDLIGMGLSDKPQIDYRFFDHVRYLDAFIDQLGLEDLTLVAHDWGAILGLYYATRNAANVKGIVLMEAMIRPYAHWSDFPAALRPTFRTFRAPNVGFEKIVVDNDFIEKVLPASMLRKLSTSEMDCYRMPFRDPASRKVIWQLATEIPVEGRPADVAEAVGEYGRWLKASSLPKLFIYATPGAITSEADVRWCKDHWKNLAVESIGPGIHFHQEDNPDGVGRAIARWYQSLR